MSTAVTNTRKVAVEIETTEGTYVAPSAGSSFVQVLRDGYELNESKELLERDIYTGSIGDVTPRTGTKSVSGNIPTECRAFSVEGGAPEYDKLMRSAFGTKRQNTTAVTTKASGNTDSVLHIEDADIAKFNIGDIILVKEAGAYHASPITAKSVGAGTATITLLVPHPDGDMSDSVSIAKFTTYTVAESGHPTVSVTEYLDDAIKKTAAGCRVNKFALSDFATGKMPKLAFGFDGLTFDRSLEAPAYSPSYDTAQPPIALDARLYMNGTEIEVNEISISVESTASFKTAFRSPNGKISSRLTSRKVTGSFNPYQDTTDISNYTKFVNNTEFSLFAYAKNATSTAGEFENMVAVYMPKCLITELATGDADGSVQENITFKAGRGASGTTDEIYFCFV